MHLDPIRLGAVDIVKYTQPAIWTGFIGFLVSVYLMKYTTDVLGMSPVIVGSIMFVSRIWDAVSDPVIGYLSDRTSHRMGRRRPWVLYSCVPVAISFVMIWSPPEVLSGGYLTTWMAFCIILFFTASTALQIPLLSWGAELTDSYHDRTTLFGVRHGLTCVGFLLAVVTMYFLAVSRDPRSLIFNVSVLVGVASVAALVYLVKSLGERSELAKKVEENPFKSYVGVLKNGYARVLIGAHLAAVTGQMFASVFTLYVSEYILGNAQIGSLLLMIYLVASIATSPLWIFLSRKYDKKTLWLSATIILAVSFGCAFFMEFGGIPFACAIYVAFGVGASGCHVIPPSIQADVIDFGECINGKRTEGAYFASWFFAEKTATAITFLIAGTVLELADFVPNVEQTQATKTFLLIGFSVVPMFFYLISIGLLLTFKFDENKYNRVRSILNRKSQPGRLVGETGSEGSQ
jgi:glycoside/pentoside/hexuronide:cation symporter, GPH family